MVIYIVYKDGVVMYPTTLPMMVLDAFKNGADTIQAWRNERLGRTFRSVKEFERFINPPRSEDEEQAGGSYEW